MEDKRTALAFFISMIVVMIYLEYMFAPYKNRPVVAPQTTTASTVPPIAPVQPLSPVGLAPQIAASTIPNTVSAATNQPTTAELASAELTTIESNKVIIKINHLGGRIAQYLLKDYYKDISHAEFLNLVVALENTPLPMGVYVDNVDDARVAYKLTQVTGSALDSSGKISVTNSDVKLIFEGQHPQLGTIQKTLTIHPSSYLFDLAVALRDEKAATSSNLWVEWLHYVPEAQRADHMSFNSFDLLSDGKIRHVLGADINEGYSETTSAGWAGFNDKYFLSALVPEAKDLNTKLGLFQNTFVTRVAGGLKSGTFHLYMGPKDFTILKELPYDLVKCIDLGWFSVLAHPLLSLLRILNSFLGNWGLAIIALTLLIKTAFLPLTKKSFTSMKAMQDLQPEMKALRERIKDSTQLNQEMLALYKKRGVNPMGGCLPILIQIPVFLGLYNALLYAIELRHAHFAVWVGDLSAPERLEILGIGVPVMVILMGALMLIQQYLTPSTGDPMQKKMMMFTSLLFTVFFVGFPSGLTMYWLTNSLISIVQQFAIRDDNGLSPGKATLVASVVIMVLAYGLTLI